MRDGYLVKQSQIVDTVAISNEGRLRERIANMRRHFTQNDLRLGGIVSFDANGPDDEGIGSIDFIRRSGKKAKGHAKTNEEKSSFHR